MRAQPANRVLAQLIDLVALGLGDQAARRRLFLEPIGKALALLPGALVLECIIEDALPRGVDRQLLRLGKAQRATERRQRLLVLRLPYLVDELLDPSRDLGALAEGGAHQRLELTADEGADRRLFRAGHLEIALVHRNALALQRVAHQEAVERWKRVEQSQRLEVVFELDRAGARAAQPEFFGQH